METAPLRFRIEDPLATETKKEHPFFTIMKIHTYKKSIWIFLF